MATSLSAVRYRYDLFICHSSEDKDSVRILAAKLGESGIRYWLDEEQIKPGDSIVGKIADGLAASRWVLVALSASTNASNWCQAEYQSLMHQEISSGQPRVIPVLLHSLKDQDIPPLLRYKRRVDATTSDGIRELISRVGRSFSVRDYCDRLINQPVQSGRLYSGDYQVVPSDLLRIELREIDFAYGGPIRAVRTPKAVRFDSFIRQIGNEKVVVLLGEAGIGKTTTCKWLCYQLAQSVEASGIVPFYFSLGEWDAHMEPQEALDRQAWPGTFDELARAVEDEGFRLLLLLDGWNEQEPEQLARMKGFVSNRCELQNTIVVLTSRPVTAVDTIWDGHHTRFFEILRWTDLQLQAYFDANEQAGWFKQIPASALNCMRLPLLAFLMIKRLDQDSPLPSFRTVADVFAYALRDFLGGENKDRAISRMWADLGADPKTYLRELARRMTEAKTIQTTGALLESTLPEPLKIHFKPLLARLINSGLLRSSNALMALDPDASVAELRQMKISFLHQSFQEYLTAKWYLSSLHPQLPPDVSHDAFWREVPIYIIQSYSHPTDQQEFALSFLLGDNPDYFTASRLVNEITDPGIRRIVEKRVVELLLQDIERPYVYAYAIDTFDSLGQAGKEALRASLGDTSRLSMIHAGAEVHLADRTVEGADETSWRALGRSIYILGELGDAWLAGHLAACVGSVRSLHLLYHIAEALLTLSRISDPPEQLREIILSAVTTLSQVSGGDPVIRAYAYATVAPWSDAVDLRRECAEELRAFLMGQTDTSREHFPHEFWRRAHGVEAFVEVAEPDIASEVLTKLFRAENTADYRGYEDGDFRKVHSSILKAMLRSGDLHSETHFGWRSLLELLFESNRISSNAWACRHLERLLVRWFRSSEDIAWIRGWRDSQKIGGVQIGTVLSNVIWSSS